MPIHEDRHRATSFGAVAEQYDRTRPSYPDELVDWLTRDERGDAVDVGCGTGQLGRLLQDREWNVVGVEADGKMAAVASGHGLPVDVAKFEDWDAGPRRFDLLTSAQAWHWIDPEFGGRKAADVLRSGGRTALIWTEYSYQETVSRVLHEVFARHAPDLVNDSVLLGTVRPDHERLDIAMFERMADRFMPPAVVTFDHERHVTVDDYLSELPTHSQIATMAAVARDALIGELAVELGRVTPHGVHIRHPLRVTAAVRR